MGAPCSAAKGRCLPALSEAGQAAGWATRRAGGPGAGERAALAPEEYEREHRRRQESPRRGLRERVREREARPRSWLRVRGSAGESRARPR